MKTFLPMTEIAVWNYRCFQSKQVARLAPLTLLVGANSTGKTSFLALLRAMHQVTVQRKAPDFSVSPYDLGTFKDIICLSDYESSSPDSFSSSLRFTPASRANDSILVSATFKERGGAPFPFMRAFANKEVEFQVTIDENGSSIARVTTNSGQWRFPTGYRLSDLDFESVFLHFLMSQHSGAPPILGEGSDMHVPPSHDLELVRTFIRYLSDIRRRQNTVSASAPVRSRPRYTFDTMRPSRDSAGDDVTDLLAQISYLDGGKWRQMKQRLEDFGKQFGLFSQIEVKQVCDHPANRFQLQIRRHGASSKSRMRNITDAGYGINQVLPHLTELLRPDARDLFLLQQPEVHLHPIVQAELGVLFGTIAAEGRQLIVETHSDYLINRVRLDIRDQKSRIEAKDVSILYFESDDENVRIHSITIDQYGNIIGAPPSYRKFFMDEIEREISI